MTIRLFKIKEGFQTQSEKKSLKPETIEYYNKFLLFYNPFCINWQKAIKSSVALELPQQPLTDPSQVYSSSASNISDDDMNKYITELSHQLSYSLPPICKARPSTIDSDSLPIIVKQIPTSIEPYIAALNWMNSQLENSQKNLGSALQGKSPTIANESFDNFIENFDNSESMCHNIASCIANNPELVKQLASELSEQQEKQDKEQQEQQEEILIKLITPFITTPTLSQAFKQNITLVQKSQKIQDQAQSGELVNKINVADESTSAPYQMPKGANNLIDIKQNNPSRYNEIQQKYGPWVSIKNTLDQINAKL